MAGLFLVNVVTCCLLVSVTWAWVNEEIYIGKRGFFSKVGCKLFGSGCSSPEENVSYGLLFDAGSSSTKLKVYRVTPAEDASSLPRLDSVFSERFAPGLGDVQDVRDYLVNILEVAKEKIPESKQKETPIYLLATDGLRFLSADDATNLIEEVKSVFSDSSVSPFIYKPAGVGILSGEEEGVYAWVAANYLLGFFDKNRSEAKSVGILEMGGGSTQITFQPNSPLYEGEFQVRVLGQEYELYVHSYLQFGINAINIWVAEVLAEWNPEETTLNNPCMLEDDETDVQLEDGRELKLTGTGDPSECNEILEHILKPETGYRCEPKPCAIGSVYQPSLEDIQFYATQGFTYAPKELGVVGDDEILHISELEEAATEYCGRSLSEAIDAGIKESLASTTCLMGLYIPKLFTLSYGFSPDTSDITVTSNIGNDSIDWGLGAMVIELSGNSVRRRR
uniref:Uncharacterized protein n=1 Tax=Arion vulgaris TaxID=1028688 RepID=A0A0B7BDQ0_9EUPU